ncbi:acyl-CoA dehydrogenase family protein [Actinomycetospora sp. TBRC 11914]|uniref:acyl-CoA dehydrogenase family protein n=1 Tax=Actinomycetospora sp. TBRC 11914 TaxID=2729387 RepID=UPI00145DB642|nr:acyl-CoA dehydrogenase family protein [Actinomycetospora sp. TBRC 11914]NMO89136.1 acyl-CoA dehydrogenase [Actinomycetospora sp. TBRC 11914]
MAAPTDSRPPSEDDRSAPAPEEAGESGAVRNPFDELPRPHLALEPDGPHLADFYAYADLLTDAEREHLRRLRAYLASDVAPVVDEAWASDSFPDQLVDGFAGLDLAGLPYGLSGWSDEPARRVFMGFVHAEIARVDASTNSFFGVHCGLAMGSIDACGTPEQKQRWLPPMARMETLGAFGLTEPHGGSDVAGGMETTARREGDAWVIDGHKRWIGNGTFADVIVIWARDVSDGEEGRAVRGFVVPRETAGLTTTKIEGKTSLRITQNADITLDGVRVPEENRLSGGKGTFADAGAVLRRTRGNASWACTGVQMAAYELALSYAQEREQFGRPIAGFQMIQDALVQMLGNTTASLGMAARNAQLIDGGGGSDAHSALAKQFCADRMRETVALGRQVVGGNGIIVGNGIARYFADAEALYSYEGTREMNTLIVGKAVTGHSAFVR